MSHFEFLFLTFRKSSKHWHVHPFGVRPDYEAHDLGMKAELKVKKGEGDSDRSAECGRLGSLQRPLLRVNKGREAIYASPLISLSRHHRVFVRDAEAGHALNSKHLVAGTINCQA